MTFPSLRPRKGVTPVSGLRQIWAGIFGNGNPNNGASGQVSNPSNAYHFHEGDVFTPGTANWALDPSHDTPLDTVWGHGILAPVNQFSPIHPGLVITFPAAIPTGIGGVSAGQLISQPLSDQYSNEV